MTDSIVKKLNTEEPFPKIVVLPDCDDAEVKQRIEGALSEQLNKDCEIKLSPPLYLSKGIKESDVFRFLNRNEDGDAELFIKLFYNKYVFDHAAQLWYYWNDHYWRQDKLNHIVKCIQDLIEVYDEQMSREKFKAELYAKNNKTKEHDKYQAMIAKYQKRIEILQTLYRKKNVLSQASMGKYTLGITGDEWDKNPYLLGCKNGVLNLKEGTFDGTGNRQSDYIKTISPTVWKGINEPCPEWERFLDSAFKEPEEKPIIPFLQRLIGYTLRGDTKEHIYPIFYGEHGRNGKGTILETLKYVFGELAYKAPAEFLMKKTNSQQSADTPSATLMKLRGVRLVWCSETNEGDRIDPAKLKELVGGDTISARSPFGKSQIEFEPTHTLFTMTNSKPQMPANDSALWDRIILVNFKLMFVSSPDPAKPYQVEKDPDLKAKLRNEASGILAWAVRGAILYEQQGLMIPNIISESTKSYRTEQDLIEQYIEECCAVGDINDPAYRAKSKDLYEAYQKWCSESGCFPVKKQKFRKSLFLKGFEEKGTGANGTLLFRGITCNY